MNAETPIARAVRILGGQSAASRRLECSQPTVWDWVRKGKITAEYVIPMEKATTEAGEPVSRHELRPDLYPIENAA
jgi:DNA-binding transcriptional regulator YdaS (Cro superfamily)